MMKKVVWLALLCCCFGFSANAGHREKALTLTPMIGGHTFDGNLDLDHSSFAGVGLGYNLTENWTVEGVFTRTEADGKNGGSDAKVKTYRVDALYHLQADSAFVPYLAAGIGGISTNYDHGNASDHLLVNYGAGVKYFILDDLIALRGDVRHLIDFPHPENSLQYSIGLVFQFGKATQVSGPAAEKQPDPVQKVF